MLVPQTNIGGGASSASSPSEEGGASSAEEGVAAAAAGGGAGEDMEALLPLRREVEGVGVTASAANRE